MLGDIDPPRDPDVLMGGDMVEEAGQRRDPSRPPDEAAMQAHRHHLRRGLALRVERVERVAQVGEEVVAGVEPWRATHFMSLASSV